MEGTFLLILLFYHIASMSICVAPGKPLHLHHVDAFPHAVFHVAQQFLHDRARRDGIAGHNFPIPFLYGLIIFFLTMQRAAPCAGQGFPLPRAALRPGRPGFCAGMHSTWCYSPIRFERCSWAFNPSCSTWEKLMFCSKAAVLSHAGMVRVFLTDFSKCALAYRETSTDTIFTKESQSGVCRSSSFATASRLMSDSLEGEGMLSPSIWQVWR